MARYRLRDLRRRIYQVLEQGPVGDHLSRWVDRSLVALIIVNLVAVALESIPAYAAQYANIFALISIFRLSYSRLNTACGFGLRSSTALFSICRPCARA